MLRYTCILALFCQLLAVAQIQRNPILLEEQSFGRVYGIGEQAGALYLASEHGLYKYDFHQGQFLNEQLSLPPSLIALSPSDSGLFLGFMNSGLYHYNSSTQKTQAIAGPDSEVPLPASRVGYIYGWHLGSLWFESHMKGLCSWSPQAGLKVYAPSASYPNLNDRGTDIITGFIPFPDDENKIWVATLNGVFVLDLNQGKYIQHFALLAKDQLNDVPLSKRESSIRSMVYSAGKLLVGSWGGGLLELDTSDGKFVKHIYEPAQPLTTLRNNIRVLNQISDSLLLCATPHGPLCFFNSKRATFLGLDQLSPLRSIKSVGFSLVSNSGWYIANPKGLWQLAEETTYMPSFPSGEIVMSVLPIDTASFWYTLYSNKRELHHYPSGNVVAIPGENVPGFTNQFHVLPYGDKKVVYSSFKCFLETSPGNFTQLPSQFQGVESETFILSGLVDEDKGLLYLGRKNGSIEEINLQNFSSSLYWLPQQRNWIKDLCLLKGKLYFVAEQQVGMLQGDSLITVSTQNIAKRLNMGLSNFVRICAGEGKVYFGTEELGVVAANVSLDRFERVNSGRYKLGLTGLCFRDGRLYIAYDKGLWIGKNDTGKFYSSRYGFDSPRWLSSIGGKVFLGSHSGLFDISKLHEAPSLAAAEPFLKSVRLMNKQVPLPISGLLSIEPNENWLRVQFGAKAAGARSLLSLQYRLIGLHKDWRALEGDNTLAYSGLEPGEYELEIRAGLLGEAPIDEKLLAFKVKYAWYENPYLQAFGLLLFLLVVYWVFRTRLKAVQREQQLKKELDELELQMMKVQMNPHFLFNALNSVRYYILKESPDEASNYLARFSKLLRFMLKISNQAKVLLSEELTGIKLYLEFEQLRFKPAFTFEIEVDKEVKADEVYIPSMLIQPFLENAIWHGFKNLDRAPQLKVGISRKQEELQIEITDNGVGRAASAKLSAKAHESQGLSITKARLAALSKITASNYQLEINDLYQAGDAVGTQVIIALPYESMDH